MIDKFENNNNPLDQIDINFYRIILYIFSKWKMLLFLSISIFILTLSLFFNSEVKFSQNFSIEVIEEKDSLEYAYFNWKKNRDGTLLSSLNEYKTNLFNINETDLRIKFYQEIDKTDFIKDRLMFYNYLGQNVSDEDYKLFIKKNIEVKQADDNSFYINISGSLDIRNSLINVMEKIYDDANLNIKMYYNNFFYENVLPQYKKSIRSSLNNLESLYKIKKLENEIFFKNKRNFLVQHAKLARDLSISIEQESKVRLNNSVNDQFYSEYYLKGYIAIEKEIEYLDTGAFINERITNDMISIQSEILNVKQVTDPKALSSALDESPIGINSNNVKFIAAIVKTNNFVDIISDKFKILFIGISSSIIIPFLFFLIIGLFIEFKNISKKLFSSTQI